MSTAAPITAQHLLEALYSDVQGYALSAAGRSRIARESDPAFTYGEITPESIEFMLQQVQAKPGEVFYDLGSGTGKAVIFASFLGSFSKAVGIEFVDELCASAQKTLERYNAEVKPLLPLEKQMQTIEFRNADMFSQDISDADVIFTHCTCFDDDMMNRISKMCEGLKSGARVITVTKGLTSPEFISLGTFPFRLAWGDATLCFYQRA